MGHEITLAFLIVVMVMFLLMVRACADISKQHPLHELTRQKQEPWSCDQMRARYGLNPQNNKTLIDVGKDYYNPMFQGLGYSYGRQFVNQDYANIVIPNPDLPQKREVYHLMEKTQNGHHLTNSGPSKELLRGDRLVSSGKEWEHGVLGGGQDDAYIVAKFHHFPGGETAEWM